MPETIDYKGWTITPGPPIQIAPPGREPLPGGYGTLGDAKRAVSRAVAHAERPVVPPETEHVMEYRGWSIHIARNPRRYTRPDWLRIQAPGEPIQPERYRKLQHAKQAIIIAQKIADSTPNGTTTCAEANEPLG